LLARLGRIVYARKLFQKTLDSDEQFDRSFSFMAMKGKSQKPKLQITETIMKYHSLIIAIIFAAIAFASNASAQTCQDGCFYSNTYQGQDALLNFYSGGQETAFGSYALTNNTTGQDNTAIGAYAMQVNTTGNSNTANGSFALGNNQTGSANTANGTGALAINTGGSSNTATGFEALETTPATTTRPTVLRRS
jgi:hypothetical protein